MFLKGSYLSNAHQGCTYLIRNTAKQYYCETLYCKYKREKNVSIVKSNLFLWWQTITPFFSVIWSF